MDIWLSREFKQWQDRLRDPRAQTRIAARLRRASEGNFGQTRSLGAGLSEMKIDEGPGYRLYFTIDHGRLVVSCAAATRGHKIAISNGLATCCNSRIGRDEQLCEV